MRVKVKNIFKEMPKKAKKNKQFNIVRDNKEKTIKLSKNNTKYIKKGIKVNSTPRYIEEVQEKNTENERVHKRSGASVSRERVKKSVKSHNTKNVKHVSIKTYIANLFTNKNKLSKGYYFLLVAMIVLGGGSVYFASKTYNLFNKEDYQTYADTNEIQDVTVSSSIDNNKDTKIEETKQEENKTENNTTQTSNTQNNNTTTKPKEVVKVQPLSFSKPLQGDVLKMYSIDKVIYSKTLELWKTHDGIDIKADIGQSVKSIEKGIIEKVYDDAFYGTTIVIDHGQGYKSSYSNLDTNVSVKVKQTVKKGQVIAKVSNTSIGEIKDDPHLHFMLYKDNKIVDPSSIFN